MASAIDVADHRSVSMTRIDILKLLRTHKAVLKKRFGVTGLALYGSFARDQAGDHSDVDILVQFDRPPGWKRYFRAYSYLEDLLRWPIDMSADQKLRMEIRP